MPVREGGGRGQDCRCHLRSAAVPPSTHIAWATCMISISSMTMRRAGSSAIAFAASCGGRLSRSGSVPQALKEGVLRRLQPHNTSATPRSLAKGDVLGYRRGAISALDKPFGGSTVTLIHSSHAPSAPLAPRATDRAYPPVQYDILEGKIDHRMAATRHLPASTPIHRTVLPRRRRFYRPPACAALPHRRALLPAANCRTATQPPAAPPYRGSAAADRRPWDQGHLLAERVVKLRKDHDVTTR
jgi:hypothetical protein